MGRYIATPALKGKAEYLCKEWAAKVIERPLSWDALPPDKALVCVVSNGPFEAAAYVYGPGEFEEFGVPRQDDPRPRTFLLMDRETVEMVAR